MRAVVSPRTALRALPASLLTSVTDLNLARMSMLDDDLTAIYADPSVTVSVVYGSTSTRGHFSTEDLPEMDGVGGVIMVPRRIVRIQAGSIGAIADDTPITVDGNSYTVHRAMSAGRGKTKIILAGES